MRLVYARKMVAQSSVQSANSNAVDYDALAKDLDALRRETLASLGPEHLEHFKKLERWSRGLSFFGWATSWVAPNPISALAMGLGTYGRWAVVAHHASHRGLDPNKIPSSPQRFRRKYFAKGWRRATDWLDWIHPEDWATEHDELHHHYTNDWLDPDLVEENLHLIAASKIPDVVKGVIIAFFTGTWKLTYYAPSAFLSRKEVERIRAARLPLTRETFKRPANYYRAFNPFSSEGREFIGRSVLPYGLTRFVAMPGCFLPLGPQAVASSLLNTLLAEVITNLWAFGTIVPSHAGDDTIRFDRDPQSRGEKYARQILGTVNYTLGDESFLGDVHDYLHGFLNYQIEHHLFPDLPPLAYKRMATKVEAICEKHGLPYRKEAVGKRIKRTLSLMMGWTKMPREPYVPAVTMNEVFAE